MRFCQLEQIESYDPGDSIQATQFLTGDEDYLRDHFPRFRVQPGVMMLEGLYQASMFLVRATVEHQAGLVMLKEVRNVKFADFLQPGQRLHIESKLLKRDGDLFSLKAAGHKDGKQAVSARVIVQAAVGSEEITHRHAGRYMKQKFEELAGKTVRLG